jgi:hypothetical protein
MECTAAERLNIPWPSSSFGHQYSKVVTDEADVNNSSTHDYTIDP